MELLSPELSSMDLATFMREALMEADLAGQAGELPIGAVLVIGGKVVSRGRARHNAARSQIRHAELNALLDGGEPLWTDYRGATLFTTVEPCPLCLGAVVMADVPHIVYALHDQVVHSKQSIAANPYIQRHIRSYHGGVLAEESARLFRRYAPKVLEYIQNGKLTV